MDLKLTTVVVTALIDSINPCAIGVLVLLISTLLVLSENKKKLLTTGLIYIAAVYVTYFLAGIGLLAMIQHLQIGEAVSVMVGFLVIFLGFIEIKSFIWYGKGFSLSIPPRYVSTIKKYSKDTTIWGAIVLGILVAAVELPCTGGPYLAITTLLAENFDFTAVLYLMLYNLIFVLPLVVIVLLAYFGTKASHIKQWKDKHKRLMRLFSGLVMIALGVLLILYARGIITLS